MTALRERLAQMGETAMAASDKTGGTGRWTCERERKDGTARVYAPSMGPLRRVVPIAETLGVYGKHISTFSPDVAAALVAVADAVADHIDCPLCGLPGGEHEAYDECPMQALAAALGVSR